MSSDAAPIATPADDLWRRVKNLLQDEQDRDDIDVDAALGELTQSAMRVLTVADHAGITIATRAGEVHTAAATGPCPAILDRIQRKYRDGPCLTAAWEHHTILVDDLVAESRWAHYCREAISRTPVRSVLALELFSDNQTMGALNFYAESPGVFGESAVELGLVLAAQVALAWNLMRRQQQFRSALTTRDLIGQAKGIMMERFQIGAPAAFDLLKRLSQESNIPLFEIAERTVNARGSGSP